ncbi:hypothetical protein DFR30_0862 [Thiogranum longum]|uniref:Uncharacterized protein n=1 Tax=Thiogranum longum TaxID=1537524 RepID=A0A4R1H753_9GAMM|nr:hypothetical protein DFR30_0862 [Thiogranum longum]
MIQAGLRTTRIPPGCLIVARKKILQTSSGLPIVSAELTVSDDMTHYSDNSMSFPARDLRGLSLSARLLLPLRG